MYVNKELASGGHQLYAPFGGLYTQSFPLREALYGPVNEQLKYKNVSLFTMNYSILGNSKSFISNLG